MTEEIKQLKIENYENKDIEKQIEADIKKLAEEVSKLKFEAEKKHISEQELIKKSLSALTPIPKTTENKIKSESSGPLPSYTQSFSPEIKLEIEYLLDIAFKEGIVKAFNQAQKSDNPVVLDAFHDALAGKLYDEFKKRNLL